jgi:hypothetical protein
LININKSFRALAKYWKDFYLLFELTYLFLLLCLFFTRKSKSKLSTFKYQIQKIICLQIFIDSMCNHSYLEMQIYQFHLVFEFISISNPNINFFYKKNRMIFFKNSLNPTHFFRITIFMFIYYLLIWHSR